MYDKIILESLDFKTSVVTISIVIVEDGFYDSSILYFLWRNNNCKVIFLRLSRLFLFLRNSILILRNWIYDFNIFPCSLSNKIRTKQKKKEKKYSHNSYEYRDNSTR